MAGRGLSVEAIFSSVFIFDLPMYCDDMLIIQNRQGVLFFCCFFPLSCDDGSFKKLCRPVFQLVFGFGFNVLNFNPGPSLGFADFMIC